MLIKIVACQLDRCLTDVSIRYAISAESGTESLDAVTLPRLKKCFRTTYSKNFEVNFSVIRVIPYILSFFFNVGHLFATELFNTKILLYLKRSFLIIFYYFLYIYIYNIPQKNVKYPISFSKIVISSI